MWRAEKKPRPTGRGGMEVLYQGRSFTVITGATDAGYKDSSGSTEVLGIPNSI